MREDMAQVVTERPRAGGGVKTPKGEKRRNQRLDVDELPKREKIRQKWTAYHNDYYGKQFTDVLGPIYRYLLSQVGQPWDNVWSEICKNLPANNTNTSHVRDHVLDFVETKTVMIDGKVCYGDGMLYGIHISGRGGRYEWQMYVHPETGILCKIKDEPRRRWKPKPPLGIEVPGEPDKQYHQINGIWYMVTLADVAFMARDHKARVYDVAYKTHFNRNDLIAKYGKYAYAYEKRQINKKEIERAGLRSTQQRAA